MKKVIKRKTKQNALPKSRLRNFSKKPVKDLKKRLFLKTIGTLGVSAFLFSLFPKKSQALVFGSTPAASVVGLKNAANSRINPATEGKQDDIINALGEVWDYTALVSAATTDTWTFKTGGSGGATVRTTVITYTDSGKGTISNVTVT